MKYRVTGSVVGSKYLGIFEAETPEEAVEKALEKTGVSLCHQCSEECEDAEIIDAFADPVDDVNIHLETEPHYPPP